MGTPPRSILGVRTAPGRLPHRVEQVHSSPGLVLAILNTTPSQSGPTPPQTKIASAVSPACHDTVRYSTEPQSLLPVYLHYSSLAGYLRNPPTPRAAEDTRVSTHLAAVKPPDQLALFVRAWKVEHHQVVEHALQEGSARFFCHFTFIMTTVTPTIEGGGRHSSRKSSKMLGREAVPGRVPVCMRPKSLTAAEQSADKIQGGVARGPFQ